MPTFLTVTGFVLVGLSLLWFAFKLQIAYECSRYPLASGGVPTLDGAIFPPVMLVGGLWLVELGRPDWYHPSLLLVWLATTIAGFALHIAIARFVREVPLAPAKGGDESQGSVDPGP